MIRVIRKQCEKENGLKKGVYCTTESYFNFISIDKFLRCHSYKICDETLIYSDNNIMITINDNDEDYTIYNIIEHIQD